MTNFRRMLLRALPLLLLGGVSCALRLWTLHKSAYAPGWDSYFYLVQVKSLAETGAMHSPDISPVYGLLYGLSQLFGDYVLAYKVLSAGLAGLFTSLSFALARKIGGLGPALVVAGWTIFSPTLTFFAAQFPKNLLGLNGLLLLLYSFRIPGWWQKGLAFAFAFVAHRMTAGLSLLFLLFRQFTWRRLLLLIGLGGLGLLVAALLPGLLDLRDLARFEGAFSPWPRLQGYAFIQLMDPSRMHLLWMAEFALAYIFFGALLLHVAQERPGRWLLGFALLLALLTFPFFQMDENGVGYRFFLTFVVLAPLCFACIPHVLPKPFFYLGFAVALGMALPGRGAYAPETFDPDYGHYSRLAGKVERLLADRDPELIIGHKGLAELTTFQTGIDVLPWLPEYPVDSSRLWRVSHGVGSMEFRYYLGAVDAGRVKKLGLEYHLLPEVVWQRFVGAVRADGDLDLLARVEGWQNPGVVRPGFLLKE